LLMMMMTKLVPVSNTALPKPETHKWPAMQCKGFNYKA
jgi:hypothetical protein